MDFVHMFARLQCKNKYECTVDQVLYLCISLHARNDVMAAVLKGDPAPSIDAY